MTANDGEPCPRHDARCVDEDGTVDDCICGLDPFGAPDTYHPDDREPMGGDPYWAQEND